ncbi:CRISPR system precrRNA processing endoribonuclease RAMP protein Cas6 [Acidithiobacillus caldus]|jgi:hypothetical protein|uniref:CRISPR-associated protein Cas6 C-terminal domain-containing protein n=1 Tax=Acidithiobacillus caldus TaxID=33059 RepID=A0A1E7YKP0_9PROT|nr:CRISPR system precrRNA processing endoribonuclease RAMP protein Cas6 [Acidithiobacillus caldus]OFC30310.1 hypothetical protein BAE27_11980 [Acidithiobacillus caldus]OFC37601.1 hypothetical protein BAE29_10385 [Acidithiobacillus caldus]OFC39188.1 hypothetical protein BAE28_04180 [Acidithiobacillus caldus]
MRWTSISPEAAQPPMAPRAEERLEDAWASFPILRLRFTLRSLGLQVPAFHASLWHGMIGARLREIDPVAYLSIWEKEQTAPYALRAPFGPTQIADGDLLSFEISLFGNAIEHTASVLVATDAACRSLGQIIRQGQRGSAVIEGIHVIAPSGAQAIRLHDKLDLHALCVPAGTILRSTPAHPVAAVRLILDAPLRLKDGGAFVTTHPRFSQILRRIFGRMRQLHPSNSAAQAKEILQRAQAVKTSGSVRWVTQARWSARQQQNMAFGGLIGFLEYQGELAEFLPWLALGSWLHIGGKSTFGFGTYQLQVAE